MKLIFILFFALLPNSVIVAQDTSPKSYTLTVTIEGFENTTENAMVALSNSEKNWHSKKEPFKGDMSKISSKSIVVTFKDLPEGEYAVKVFHDENENKELDTNFIGIPNEAYGFSNNARGAFGPPNWKDAKFNLTRDKDINIYVE